jgi:hypothetical protein
MTEKNLLGTNNVSEFIFMQDGAKRHDMKYSIPLFNANGIENID